MDSEAVNDEASGEALLKDFKSVFGDRYAVTRPLGSGASGRAYLATDMRRRIDVCVKLYRAGTPPSGSERDWYITSVIKHESLGDTFTIEDFRSDGRDCTATISRYIEGYSLSDVLFKLDSVPSERHRVLVVHLLAIAAKDVCGAIQACHRHGFGHGDLHERNVIIKREGAGLRAVVIDFDNATLGNTKDLEIERFAKDIRSLRLLIGQVTYGWKWHDAFQRLLDNHRSIAEFIGAFYWAISFLTTADGQTGNTADLNALCVALHDHASYLSVAPQYAEAMYRTIEEVVDALGLRSEFALARSAWQRMTAGRFTFHLPQMPPGVTVWSLSPSLVELWPGAPSAEAPGDDDEMHQ